MTNTVLRKTNNGFTANTTLNCSGYYSKIIVNKNDMILFSLVIF